MADLIPPISGEARGGEHPQGWAVLTHEDGSSDWQASYNGHRTTGKARTEAIGRLCALSALRALRAVYCHEPTREGVCGIRMRLLDGQMRAGGGR